MTFDLKKLERVLDCNDVITLSTSMHDKVSARPISLLNIGLTLYVRTSASSRKALEMISNPHVAICVENYYFTGLAKNLGSVYDIGNTEIKEAYIRRYPDSFSNQDEFIQSDELFFEITIETISEWVFDGTTPVDFLQYTFK